MSGSAQAALFAHMGCLARAALSARLSAVEAALGESQRAGAAPGRGRGLPGQPPAIKPPRHIPAGARGVDKSVPALAHVRGPGLPAVFPDAVIAVAVAVLAELLPIPVVVAVLAAAHRPGFGRDGQRASRHHGDRRPQHGRFHHRRVFHVVSSPLKRRDPDRSRSRRLTSTRRPLPKMRSAHARLEQSGRGAGGMQGAAMRQSVAAARAHGTARSALRGRPWPLSAS